MAEQWKDVVGYERVYEVSNWGRVRRIKRSKGAVIGVIMKSAPTKTGYPRLSLCVNNQPRQWMVHQLVASAFIGERPAGYEINHIDGVKTNASVDNLEYVTSKENSQHAVRVGLLPSGEDVHNAILTANEVREMRQGYPNKTMKELGKEYGVSRRTASDAIRRRTWKHVI